MTHLLQWLAQLTSRDGHAREAAVHAIGRAASGADADAALPLLLARANDWVPQVRAAAHEAIDRLLVDERIGTWIGAMDALAALRRTGRNDHSALLARIDAFLSRPASLRALQASRIELPLAAWRLLYRLELAAADDDSKRAEVLMRALMSSDVLLASAAVADIAQWQSPTQRLAVITVACASKFAPVRVAALRLLPPQSGLAVDLCFDASATVRAAWAVCDGSRNQIVDRARVAFWDQTVPRHRAVALDVLCELKAEGSAALCDEAMADASAVVRCTAQAHRFAQAQGAQRDALMLAALDDPSPRMHRLVALQVKRGVGVTQGAISQHLKSLKLAGLVIERAEGRNAFYRAEPDGLTPLADWMGHYGVFWRGRFAELRNLLKEIDP